MRIASDIAKHIGNTPMVRLDKIGLGIKSVILAKLESYNPMGSIKDRVALAMIEDAQRKGMIKKDPTIIESTSGNTGIALAGICAVKGYRLIITMPESMSPERRQILKAFGAEVVTTSSREGMEGAMRKADQLVSQVPNSCMLDQFRNPVNSAVHRLTTAREIWRDTQGHVDCLVCGVGTGGTIMGLAQAFKKKKKNFLCIAVEPSGSPVLSGRKPGRHKIQGIGAGFIPPLFDRSFIDEIICVGDEEAAKMTRRLAKEEGILAGISSGAALAGAMRVASRYEKKKKTIVVIFPDGGERYLSTWVFKG